MTKKFARSDRRAFEIRAKQRPVVLFFFCNLKKKKKEKSFGTFVGNKSKHLRVYEVDKFNYFQISVKKVVGAAWPGLKAACR